MSVILVFPSSPFFRHPREGGDPVARLMCSGYPLGSRLRGND